MNDSRCGILCSECGFKEQMSCKGCITIDKPFWGESCPVKACCEGREKDHCGQCSEFPCAMLNQMAYDENQGDCGKRIEQCKKWSEK